MKTTGDWELMVESQQLRHSCGLRLEFEGRLSDPDAVTLSQIPAELSPLELVTLIRQGTEYCRAWVASSLTDAKR